MNETAGPIRVAVAGLGYWGPNLARNMGAIKGCEVTWLCDASSRLASGCLSFPGARASADLDEVLADEQLDAVVLATPVPTHADLAVAVARAGKHCFVEKPLATNAADAERAVAAAAEAGRILMVGHLLEYHPAVARLKELIASQELGDLSTSTATGSTWADSRG